MPRGGKKEEGGVGDGAFGILGAFAAKEKGKKGQMGTGRSPKAHEMGFVRRWKSQLRTFKR